MEAKQIHRIFYKQFYLAQWLDKDHHIVDESQVHYDYLGVGEEFQREKFEKIIADFFGKEALYVAITLSKSLLVETSLLADTILPYLGKKEIGIMNQTMDKMLFFSHIGSFQKGIYKEFPKEREKTAGTPLKVQFGANMYESKTEKVVRALEDILPEIEKALHQDYGGSMEELWIDLELIEGRGGFKFRFQKRVGIQNIMGTHIAKYYYNVGHYSVTPDFEVLKNLRTEEEIRHYILNLIYLSTEILQKKSKALGEFDAEKFRKDFYSAITNWLIS